MRALRLLIIPSPLLRFLHSGYHLSTVRFVSRPLPSPRRSQPLHRAGIHFYPASQPSAAFSQMEPMSSPRFLGNPFRTFALLLDPGGSDAPGSTAPRCCSRNRYHESSRYSIYFRGSITRLLYPLSTLRASIALHAQDSLPAGCQPLPDRTFTCWVTQRIFSVVASPPILPDLSWRQAIVNVSSHSQSLAGNRTLGAPGPGYRFD